MQDEIDHKNLMSILENEIVPTYYKDRSKWMKIVKQGMRDVIPHFDSDRMAHQYYEQMY
jgi:glycogen phosphorylase